jgi:CheY-like chemotaxis protein
MTPSLHCLLIDDDTDDGEIWSLVVKEIDPGIRTDTITQPTKALSCLEEPGYEPQLIFLDLNMPRMDGVECLKRIRLIEHHKGTPVVIYSTSTNPKDKEKCAEYGASDYLIKPASLSALRMAISGILDKYQIKAITS